MEPFDTVRTQLPGWTIAITALEGVMGYCDTETRTIWIDSMLSYTERRSTIMHEALHAVRGDLTDDPESERIVQIETARRLVSIEALATVMTLAPHAEDVCDILGVDDGVLRTRLRNLDRDEAALLRRALSRTQHAHADTAGPGCQCLIAQWWRRARQPDPLPCNHVEPAIIIDATPARQPKLSVPARRLNHTVEPLPSMADMINAWKERPQWVS